MTLHGFGEPLLHPHFLDLVRFWSYRDIAINFTTNGTLLSDEISKCLVDCQTKAVTVSLDAASEEIFSMMRPNASLVSVLRNVLNLQSRKTMVESIYPKLLITMVVTKHNYLEAFDVLKLAGSLCAEEVILHPFIPPKAHLADWCWIPDASSGWFEELEALSAELKIRLTSHLAKGTSSLNPILTGCRRVLRQVYVAVDGAIYPCCYVPHQDVYRLGHLNQESLGEIWGNNLYKKLRQNLVLGREVSTVCRACPEYLS